MSNAVRKQYESKALKLELQAEKDVAADLSAKLMRVYQDMTAAYVRYTGDVDKPLSLLSRARLTAKLVIALGGVRVQASKSLSKAVKGALALGVEMARLHVGKKVVVTPRPDREVRRAIRDIDKLAQQDLKDALSFMKSLTIKDFSDLSMVMAKANQAVTRVERATRWATNRSINQGSIVVAKAAGAQLLWVHERGACLTCLKYSGMVIDTGKNFPAGLTFGDQGSSTVKIPITGPPAHPNCRCRLVPWLGSKSGVGPVEMPDALKREAQREVLRGTAGATERQRLKAADRLLNVGTSLPKTVQKRARLAVQKGTFV
jgi:hypothetical protein